MLPESGYSSKNNPNENTGSTPDKLEQLEQERSQRAGDIVNQWVRGEITSKQYRKGFEKIHRDYVRDYREALGVKQPKPIFERAKSLLRIKR